MLLEGQSLEQCAAAEGTGEPKLFLVDYWDLYGLLGVLTDANKDANRVQHAGRCILFRCGVVDVYWWCGHSEGGSIMPGWQGVQYCCTGKVPFALSGVGQQLLRL